MTVCIQPAGPYFVRDDGAHNPIQAPRRDLEKIMVAPPDTRRSNHNSRCGRHDRGPHTSIWVIGERRVDRQCSRHEDHGGSVEEHDGRVRTGHAVRTDKSKGFRLSPSAADGGRGGDVIRTHKISTSSLPEGVAV